MACVLALKKMVRDDEMALALHSRHLERETVTAAPSMSPVTDIPGPGTLVGKRWVGKSLCSLKLEVPARIHTDVATIRCLVL